MRGTILRAAVLSLAVLPTYRPTDLSAQDPTGTWRTLETAHFDVHVRAEHRAVGLRAAAEAEAAYVQYTLLLPPPSSRIDLVVADNADDANGFATTYPRPRIVVWALPPAGDIQLESYDRWLRLVIVHELAHIFHLDLARGWWHIARLVLGRAPFLFPNQYTPGWMHEGLAVFYESRLTDAGRLGRGYLHAITSAEDAEGGGMDVGRASTSSPRWPSGLAPYAFGSRLMSSAAARAGDSAIAGFARATAIKPVPYLQLGAAFRRAVGVSLGVVWREADGRDGQDGQDGQDGPPDRLTVLSRLRLAVPPRLTPDASQLLFAFDDGKDATRLVSIDRATGRQRRIARLNGPNGIAPGPDGATIVSQLEYTDLYTLRADLWKVAPGGRATRLTHGARLREPDVTEDGAIVAVRALPGGTELVMGDGGTGGLGDWRTIGPSAEGVEWASPRFDPTGQRIAAVRVDRGWHDIVLLGRDGTLLRRLTSDRTPDLMPAFSTDGRWLTWSREIDGTPQIVGVRLDAEAGDSTAGAQFTSDAFAAYGPAPASDSLFYLSYHADGFRLVATPLSGRPWRLPPLLDRPLVATDSTVTVVHRERGYRGIIGMMPQYWIPLLFTVPQGTWFGAFTSGEDALGRHRYSGSLRGGTGSVAGKASFDVAWQYAGPGHLLTDLSLYSNPTPYLNTSGPFNIGQILCCDPDQEAHAGLSFVRRRWRSLAQLRIGAEYSNDFRAERIGGSLTASLARTITPALAISTQDGARLSATLRYRRRTNQDLSLGEFTVRGSLYNSRPTRRFSRRVMALRAAFGVAGGNDPAEFSVGGVSGGQLELLPGVSIGGGARTFPVRGFQPRTLHGRRAAAASIEFREPIALVARGPGLFPLGLDKLSAALFFDGGMAWSGGYCPMTAPSPGSGSAQYCSQHIVSGGVELATDLVLFFSQPLRLRAGAAWGLRPVVVAQAVNYLAVGSSF